MATLLRGSRNLCDRSQLFFKLSSLTRMEEKPDEGHRVGGAFVHIHKTCVSVLCVAGLAGCSAAPYAAPALAPPDRLHAFMAPPPPTLMDQVLSWGISAYVPVGDGTGNLAPNYSGYIPPLRASYANLNRPVQASAQSSKGRSIRTRTPAHLK